MQQHCTGVRYLVIIVLSAILVEMKTTTLKLSQHSAKKETFLDSKNRQTTFAHFSGRMPRTLICVFVFLNITGINW